MSAIPRPKPSPDIWQSIGGWIDASVAAILDGLERVAGAPAPALAIGAGILLMTIALLASKPFRSRTRRSLSCRWIPDRLQQKRDGLKRWICAECGVDAYTTGRRPPRECKRALRPPPL